MEKDIREFLEEIGEMELVDRGVLRPDRRFEYLLTGESVLHLMDLMREHAVTRLVAEERSWFLASDGEFKNPKSYEIKEGHQHVLEKRGNVFNEQNPAINPFFRGKPPESHGVEEDSPISFGLERDLQRVLRHNIEQLETGLSIIDGGTERTVDAGRIDITAKDGDDNLVVIELKAGTAGMDSIGQILSYMGSIENPEGKHVRGILVAYDFDRRLEMAAKAASNVSLKAYSVQFTFQDRG